MLLMQLVFRDVCKGETVDNAAICHAFPDFLLDLGRCLFVALGGSGSYMSYCEEDPLQRTR